jgi:hypothetical protein
MAALPTLKRGANNHCAYGADWHMPVAIQKNLLDSAGRQDFLAGLTG